MKTIVSPTRTLAFMAAVTVAVLGFAPGTAKADFIVNTDGTVTAEGVAGANVTTPGHATVNAQVKIHFDADGTMTVTLYNLLNTTTTGDQILTGITVNTQPTINVSSPLKSVYGQLMDTSTNSNFVETGATALDNNNDFVDGTPSSGDGI